MLNLSINSDKWQKNLIIKNRNYLLESGAITYNSIYRQCLQSKNH